MTRVAHIIGNGPSCGLYKPAKGLKITCNVPPFEVSGAYTTCIVDFKMMKAIHEGSIVLPGDWTLGFRPKKWMEMKPQFYMKHAHQVKEFYTHLPEYAGKGGQGYTNFNCGHMATHYTAAKLKADEIHLYGFDSLFDFDLTSTSDAILNSDRGLVNNNRLIDNWRPIWKGIFDEFKDVQFVFHNKHDKMKIKQPKHVDIVTT